jgi:hypothetical protein
MYTLCLIEIITAYGWVKTDCPLSHFRHFSSMLWTTEFDDLNLHCYKNVIQRSMTQGLELSHIHSLPSFLPFIFLSFHEVGYQSNH